MPGTFKIIEVVGTSPASFADAVKAGVAEASRTIKNPGWFQVVEERGHIRDGKVDEFQVMLKIGYKLES